MTFDHKLVRMLTSVMVTMAFAIWREVRECVSASLEVATKVSERAVGKGQGLVLLAALLKWA